MRNVSILLENTEESYYWIGFILADGSIDHKIMRLRIIISDKDIGHLQKLSSYINRPIRINSINMYGKTFGQCGIDVTNKKIITKLVSKINIHPNKTKNPPASNILEIDDDLFISLLVGFIDGDGSISKFKNRTDCFLRIKIDRSWHDFLEAIRYKLIKIFGVDIPQTKITKSGYSELTIANVRILRFLKNEIIKLKLPYLNRKWDKIDVEKLSFYEISEARILIIKNMLSNGYKQKDIAKKLNMSNSGISLSIKRNNLR